MKYTGPTPHDVVGTCLLGTIPFNLCRGLSATVEAVNALDQQDLTTAFLAVCTKGLLAGVAPSNTDMRIAVARELQRFWYERDGGTEPERVKARRIAHLETVRGCT